MCEIFLIKKNKEGIIFDEEQLSEARDANSDGAGYVIFEYDEKMKGFDVIDVDFFDRKQYAYSYNTMYNPYTYQEHYTVTREKAKQKKKDKKKKKEKQERQCTVYENMYDYPEYPLYTSYTVPQPKDETASKMYEKQKTLKDNQIMIMHFRLATSGNTKENTQPIFNGDYLTIHNGIFSYTEQKDGYSDTRHFSELLKYEIKKKKKVNEKVEREVIEKLLVEAGGYYSIFVYSFITKKIYYYKSDIASFHFAYNDLLGSTKKKRFPILSRIAKSEEVISI